MNKQLQSENRKALPKYLGIILICMLFGAVIGFIMGFTSFLGSPESLTNKVYKILNTILPYANWIITGFFTILNSILYKNAKSMYQNWDGENELVIEKTEEKLSWILLFSSLNMVLVLFFGGLIQIVADFNGPISSILTLLGMCVGLGIIVFTQQKVVDFTKIINPEKKGSVYDTKFKDKWYNSCDENEQRQIGQACYKSFTVTSTTCVVLWLLLVFISYKFSIGILPNLVVMVIFGVLQISCAYESIKISRHN